MSQSTLTEPAERWLATNQRYLAAALQLLRTTLALHRLPGQADASAADQQAAAALAEVAATLSEPAALETLCARFGLSPFERAVLLLCAGIELDQNFAEFYARCPGNPSPPTFSGLLAALPDAHWSALCPDGPLRRWRLIDMRPEKSVVNAPLRIDERILHYLQGVDYLAEPLVGYVRTAWAGAGALVPSHTQLVEQAVRRWLAADAQLASPVIHLAGTAISSSGKEALAVGLAARLGLALHVLDGLTLPATPYELATLMRLWEREAALSNSALLLDCEAVDASDGARLHAIRRFIEETTCVLLIADRGPHPGYRRPAISLEIGKLVPLEQQQLWQQTLGDLSPLLNGHVEKLVSQFDLTPAQIEAAGRQVIDTVDPVSLRDGVEPNPGVLARELWTACRVQARPQVAELAQCIDPSATWADLVLPPRQLETLHLLALHLRQRHQVYNMWGFATKSTRGLGISALFAGPSGTGKTMAAEVLANELQLDLYRIDLSQVVSKYIGETEKNLRRVFDAAELGGAILLFDEADALFGKRSEVKDSHDRYANIEVSYLLQRMEAYRGLAILTTNLKNALDDAFMRRIRFKVQFPFPDGAARAEIWRRIFPAQTPTAGLDPLKLAQLNVAGGNIRNIALQAAFLAAEHGGPVSMPHLLQAAQAEYAKLEKPLPSGEVKGWL